MAGGLAVQEAQVAWMLVVIGSVLELRDFLKISVYFSCTSHPAKNKKLCSLSFAHNTFCLH